MATIAVVASLSQTISGMNCQSFRRPLTMKKSHFEAAKSGYWLPERIRQVVKLGNPAFFEVYNDDSIKA